MAADACTNLTPAALLIGRIEGIDSKIVHVDRAAWVDQPQRTSPVGAPERLVRIGPVVKCPRVQLGGEGAEDFEAQVVTASNESAAVKARLHVHAFVVVDQSPRPVDDLLLTEPQRQ
jgi:hypothetical protein